MIFILVRGILITDMRVSVTFLQYDCLIFRWNKYPDTIFSPEKICVNHPV